MNTTRNLVIYLTRRLTGPEVPRRARADGKEAETDGQSDKVVRKEMRRRDSHSAATQLTSPCQTNSGVADSGFLCRASEQPLAAVG